MEKKLFENRKINIEKLAAYGFVKVGEQYQYTTELLEGQFALTIMVAKSGAVTTKVMDVSIDEEYILHRVSGASGAFVGAVKAEYQEALQEVAERCYDCQVFNSADAKSIIRYVGEKYGDELEYLWKSMPRNAIVRRQDNAKWYAAMLTVAKSKLGIDSDELIEVIDLRLEPEPLAQLIDKKRYFPGYHMNKKHWYTICLDGSVPIDEIYKRIDVSYQIAAKK